MPQHRLRLLATKPCEKCGLILAVLLGVYLVTGREKLASWYERWKLLRDETAWETFGGHRYMMTPEPGNWYDAEQYARWLGGHLVKVDDADARRMLSMLSATTHLVHSAVVVRPDRGPERTDLVTTIVRFVELDASVIDWYVATGEPHDKAGAYALQGGAAAFVESIDGSVTNVIGLPLAQTLALLHQTIPPIS